MARMTLADNNQTNSFIHQFRAGTTMSRFRFWRSLTSLTLSAAALCGVLTPVMALGNPIIRVADGVEYMSGGRDAEEMGFLQMVSPRWAVALEFAVNRGPRNAFPASVKVSVNDKYTGRPVMDAMCNGPVMLARLEVGTYDIQATVGGLTLTQSVTVLEGGSAKAVFLWPSNFDFASVIASSDLQQAVNTSAPVATYIKPDSTVGARGRQAAIAGEHD